MQGHQDSALTDLGVQQALWLGERLKDDPIDVTYSSSSYRALRTAELINQHRTAHIHQSDDLREIGLGSWEGKTQSFVKENHAEQFENFWNDPEAYMPSGGETFQEVASRATRKLSDILSLHGGKSILVVSHTVVVKLLMAYFEKRALKLLWNPPYIHPVCLCHVQIKGDMPSILLYGDTSHYKVE